MLEDKIIKAVLTLERRGSYPSTVNIAKLTGAKNHGVISYFLRKRFSKRFQEVRNEFGLDIPSPQALRESLKLYSGNLYEARKIYGSSLEISSTDWYKNIRIPTSIDASVAELIGIYWGTGFIREDINKKHYTHKSFIIQGKCSDKRFFRTKLKSLIKNHHNIEVKIKPAYHTINNTEYDNPRIVMSSLALLTWLVNVIGFPEDKINLDLPKIDLNKMNIIKGFIRGVIESSYSVSSSKLALSNPALNYLAGLKGLFENFNIHSSIFQRSNSNSYRLDLSVEGTTRLKIMGLFSPRQ